MKRLSILLLLLLGAGIAQAEVSPLIPTYWRNFMWPYNAYYPLNSEGPNGHEGNSCGPTSLSQILRYWESPVIGTGSDSWTENGSGLVFEADFSEAPYLWETMPHHLAWEAEESEYASTATLIHHVVTSLHDIYRTGRHLDELAQAMVDHFGFRDDFYLVNSWELTPEEWADTLKYELDHGRPIMIAGRTEDSPAPWEPGGYSGHYYIADGYNDNGEFHLVYGYGDFDYYYAPGEFGEHPAYNIALMGFEPDFSAGSRPDLEAEFDPSTGEVVLNITHADEIEPDSWTIRRDGETVATITETPFTETLSGSGEASYYVVAHFPDGDVGSRSLSLAYTPGPGPFELLAPTDEADVSLPVTLSWSASIPTSSAVSSQRHELDDEGGPDGYGYTWIDSNEPDGPTYNWIDILDEGENGPSNGTPEVTVDLPFSFPYYGEVYNEVTLSLHGLMWFGEAENFQWGTPIPNSQGPSGMIAPWWNMLSAGDGAEVKYLAEEDRFIVEWSHVNHYASWNAWFTFEAILTPDGNILFQYQSMEQRLDDATIGIESPDEVLGSQVIYRDGSYMEDELAIFFMAPDACQYTVEWSDDPDFGSSSSVTLPYLNLVLNADDITPDVVYWRVRAENRSGISTWANDSDTPWSFSIIIDDIAENDAELPGEFDLSAPWPNPFNASTSLQVSLPHAGQLRISLYDLLGRETAVIYEGLAAGGIHNYTLSARDLPSGMYFLRASSAGKTRTHKVLLMK